MSQILVVGASGTVGTELSKLLQAQGHRVLRATSKKSLAQDQVHLNVLTKEGLDTAFNGVEKAFFLAPPGHTNQHELLKTLIDLAKQNNLKKVVLMTAMGANAIETAPMRQAEIHLENSGLAYNIIRPNWFMQNFNTFWIQGIRETGKIFLPVGQAKTSFIDARDIAAVAAELLQFEKFKNKDFDLTGAQALRHDQAAQAISKATGKSIEFQDITPEAMLEGLLKAGLPRDYSEFMLVILGFLKQGYSERTTDAVKTITGREPRTFAQYAQDYRDSWR